MAEKPVSNEAIRIAPPRFRPLKTKAFDVIARGGSITTTRKPPLTMVKK